MKAPSAGLWRHSEFNKLLAGQTISLFGSQVTFLALPLTAVLTLKANAAQMGLLGAAQYLPFLLVGLFAGVWVDRRRRRPILMWADLGRALLLGSIPLVALLGRLQMAQLYLIGFLTGILTIVFDVTHQSFLPALVGREELIAGNSRLQASASIAQIGGPGLAGIVVQIFTAPLAIFVDALSFLVSVLFLSLIRTPEPPVAPRAAGRSIWAEIGEGMRVVVGNPLLRAIAGCTATSNLFSFMMQAVLILYVTRELGMSPALIGIIFGVGSVGALLGSLLAGHVARRFGLGRAIIGGIALALFANLLIPLAAKPLNFAVPLLIAVELVGGIGSAVYNINQVSLRQSITPDRLLGRMNASMRFIVWGTIPAGSLIGGFLGKAIGLRPTITVAVIGDLLAILWVPLSPVRTLRSSAQ
ncbi:MAG: MFS transporter [Dehalococcoidia bacterium]